MAIIFEGKKFAYEKEIGLVEEIKKLKKRGIIPKLASILIGDNPASILYVGLKKKAARRVGAEVEIRKYKASIGLRNILEEIKKLNKDKNVHGIMVQMPLPKKFSQKDRDEIIKTIDRKKDVDGLQESSFYLTPTVKAVLNVMREATPYIRLNEGLLKVVVIGAKGFEGNKIYKVLKEMGYNVTGLDREKRKPAETRDASILISVTGSPGIIGYKDVGNDAVVIDVGSPKGDVKSEEIMKKASFISPVPGGVGPITISALLENLVEAASN